MARKWHRSFWFKLVLFGALSALLISAVMPIHDFLAVSNPVGEGVFVVEAWIPAKALVEATNVFNSRHYCRFVVVGGPIQEKSAETYDYRTYDDLAASTLEKLGVDRHKIVKISVPAVSVGRRTLASGIAVKRWLSRSGISVCCVEVFTAGVHARKSWILFRQALGDDYRVGIIAGSPSSYNRTFWFFSRRGIWNVVRNLTGVVYSEFWILWNDKDFLDLSPAFRTFKEGYGNENPQRDLLRMLGRPSWNDLGSRLGPLGSCPALPHELQSRS